MATLSEFATEIRLQKFIKLLHERDYKIIEFKDVDPSYVHHDLHVSLCLHLLIFDEKVEKEDGHVVHIAILHDKATGWWTGGLELTERDQRLIYRQGLRTHHFARFQKASLYTK